MFSHAAVIFAFLLAGASTPSATAFQTLSQRPLASKETGLTMRQLDPRRSMYRSSLRMQSSVPADATKKKTVQILMSDTGGGHRASANALRDAFDVLYPGQISCDIVDIYTDFGPFWPYNDYVECYKIMAKYDFLWKIFFEFGATPFGLWLNELLLETFCFDPFLECLSRPVGESQKRADMVVSVHPLCQDLPLKILCSLDTNGKSRSSGRKTPFATVVTDLGGAHPTWFNKGVDKCFVPSDALRRCAKERDVSESQIVQHGLPIRKGFWGGEYGKVKTSETPESSPFKGLFAFLQTSNAENQNESDEGTVGSVKEEMRTKLNMENIPTVLVVGGGDGMGGITTIAKTLGTKLDTNGSSDGNRYQMVVVCGSNKDAVNELSDVTWGNNINVRVNGFVNNMDEWMRASDAIVTKAGPGTIAEASICGLPCMLSSFLPGQEEGNVPYVEESGFGSYSGNPELISQRVSSWLESPKIMEEMQSAALKAARPTATIDIAKDLAQILFDDSKI